MDITDTKLLLQELSEIGISEVVIEPTDDGGTRVRGSNKERNTIVFKTIENFSLVETTIGIQSVRGLLSRINLFDEEKASIVLKTSNKDHVLSVTVKQGRKNATFRCADPSNLGVPKVVPPCDITDENRITFENEYVEYINHAITAMSYTGSNAERSASIKVDNKTLHLTINDGEDDSFVDTLDDFDVVDCRGSWEISPFNKLMKLSASSSDSETAEMSISEHGVAVFRIKLLDALIPPVVS